MNAVARVRQLGGAVVAAGFIAVAATGMYRQANGDVSGAICFPIACAVAAACVAAAAGTRFQTAASWIALATLGQAASLQMIDAGPSLHYQHYLPVSTLLATRPAMLALVAFQTLAVALAVASGARDPGLGTRDPGFGIRDPGLGVRGSGLSSWRIGLAVLLSIATAATVSPDVTRYVSELAFAAYLQLLSIATIALAVSAVPDDALARIGARWLSEAADAGEPATQTLTGSRVHLDRFAWTAALATAVLAAALNLSSFERHPHVPDELHDLYHARYFAAGMLTMPAPPVPAAFDMDLMNYEPTRWYSPVAPGWPAVLAAGVAAGVPWAVNPVLTGVNVLLAYLVLGHLYHRRVTRLATVLLALSPWAIFLGMSFMTQTVTLTCALLAALGVIHARRTGGLRWGLFAGAALGALTLVRPLDGLIAAVLLGIWSIGAGGPRLRLLPLGALVIATAAVGALVLPYNAHLTGRALEFPINAYFDKYYHPNANALGFGPDRGLGWAIDPNPGHSPLDGVININLNAFGLNTDLFGWSTGSLIFITLLICSGRLNRSDRLMLAVIAAVVGAYFFYSFSGGPDFGARYWFLIVVPLVALTARGLQVIGSAWNGRAVFAAFALTAMAMVNFVPWRAIDKYHHFRGMRADVRMLAAEHHFGRDLVLVRGNRAPDYASAIIGNPIDLSSDATIYAWDRDAAVRAEVLRAYPDRRVWLIDGPSITGSGYRIAAGPLQPGAAMFLGLRKQ